MGSGESDVARFNPYAQWGTRKSAKKYLSEKEKIQKQLDKEIKSQEK